MFAACRSRRFFLRCLCCAAACCCLGILCVLPSQTLWLLQVAPILHSMSHAICGLGCAELPAALSNCQPSRATDATWATGMLLAGTAAIMISSRPASSMAGCLDHCCTRPCQLLLPPQILCGLFCEGRGSVVRITGAASCEQRLL
jgi:hypothetical protein